MDLEKEGVSWPTGSLTAACSVQKEAHGWWMSLTPFSKGLAWFRGRDPTERNTGRMLGLGLVLSCFFGLGSAAGIRAAGLHMSCGDWVISLTRAPLARSMSRYPHYHIPTIAVSPPHLLSHAHAVPHSRWVAFSSSGGWTAYLAGYPLAIQRVK